MLKITQKSEPPNHYNTQKWDIICSKEHPTSSLAQGDTWVSTGTHMALERIAKRYGVTQREMIERFIKAEDVRILAGLEYGTPECEAYLMGEAVTR